MWCWSFRTPVVLGGRPCADSHNCREMRTRYPACTPPNDDRGAHTSIPETSLRAVSEDADTPPSGQRAPKRADPHSTFEVSGPAAGESRTARQSWAASDRWDEVAAETVPPI